MSEACKVKGLYTNLDERERLSKPGLFAQNMVSSQLSTLNQGLKKDLYDRISDKCLHFVAELAGLEGSCGPVKHNLLMNHVSYYRAMDPKEAAYLRNTRQCGSAKPDCGTYSITKDKDYILRKGYLDKGNRILFEFLVAPELAAVFDRSDQRLSPDQNAAIDLYAFFGMDVPHSASGPSIKDLPFGNVRFKTEDGAVSIGLGPKAGDQGLGGAIFNQALQVGLIDFREAV